MNNTDQFFPLLQPVFENQDSFRRPRSTRHPSMSHQDTYHDTVSKMARKYSQYRLPNMADLAESGDEDEYGANTQTQQNIDTPSPHLNNNNNNDGAHINDPLFSDNDFPEIPEDHEHEQHDHPQLNTMHITSDQEDEEEDEDLQSDAQTMISHKSYGSAINIKNRLQRSHSKTSTALSSKSKKIVQFGSTSTAHYNPLEEIRENKMNRQLFTDIFDKYFDEEKQEDVDFDEFKKGLIKLEVNITPEQMKKLWDVLLMSGDNESDGYLDRDQFAEFLIQRFEAPQLVHFQNLLLAVIQEKTKKNSSRNTLMVADDAEKWDAAEVSLAEIEMRQAMEQMVDNEMNKIKVHQEFHEELERRMADPQFCQNENAESWDYYEVSHWVSDMGYPYAMKRFYDQQIDGNVLLYDLDVNMVVNRLGIKDLHSHKFMRSLNELRQIVNKTKHKSGPLEIQYDINNITIKSDKNQYEQEIDILQRENEKIKQEMEIKIRDLNSQNKLYESQNAEKVLNLQRELNKTEEKFLKSQQEVVQLNSKINELKENLNTIKNIHIGKLNEIKNENISKIKEMNDKIIDYNSMKESYDSICKQLNESKSTINSLKLQFENTKQTNQVRVDSMERQFQRENDSLNEQIKKLTKMNDSLSDENKEIKMKMQHQLKYNKSNNNNNMANIANIDSKMGPLYDSKELNNPYLDLSTPPMSSANNTTTTLNTMSLSLNQPSFGSSLQNYVQELQDKANDEQQNFADANEATKWTCQEVAYWLTTIGMKKYLAQFMEQFVDGQILLNDINAKNLISDLEVKSLHAPKIMRELNKLKRNMSTTLYKMEQQLTIEEEVTDFTAPTTSLQSQLIQELETQTQQLKNDLSESRMRMRQLQIQIDEYKIRSNKKRNPSSMTMKSIGSMNSIGNLPNLSPQSSTYSQGIGITMLDGNQSDATTLTTKSGRLYTRHLRNDSTLTARTAYSEGDAKSQLEDIREKSPTPEIPQDNLSQDWQKYVDHLEQKNRDLSTLFLRADNSLKKYTKVVIGLKEQIEQLRNQNQLRMKTIDKLNKRIERRNDTINKLKRQIPQTEIDLSRGTPQFLPLNSARSTTSSNEHSTNHMPTTTGPATMNSNPATMMTPEMQSVLNRQHKNYQDKHYAQIHQNPNQYTVRYQQYSTSRNNGSGNHHQYSSSSHLLHQKKKRKKRSKHHQKGRIILGNDNNSGKPQITGYMSGGSTASIQSAPHPNNLQNDNNQDGAGIIGSLTSYAYGYLMGGTPGQ